MGERISILHTRALLNAALAGKMEDVPMRRDPVFGFDVPTICEGIPPEILDPRESWPDKRAYDAKARELAGLFIDNFKDFDANLIPEVKAAGPHLD